ncbi:TolC family outer membrane protein [Sphingomonas lenta]|nr:TolC family outer membrane protein [Sphingomonas lenta]
MILAGTALAATAAPVGAQTRQGITPTPAPERVEAPQPPVPGATQTLAGALLLAYRGNPTLTGQRAAQRALDENVPIARSQGLPGVNAQAQATENLIIPGNQLLAAQRQFLAQTQLSVPLYQGGAVRNGVRAAETRVEAGQARLRDTEAQLFSNAVAAYMDVIRDEAVVALNRQNVRVLEINLQASRDRFEVGDLTRTDVAQSEARLAQARAQLQQAEAQLISSRENYIGIIGEPPGRLQDPPPLPNLPATPDQAVAVALDENPGLLAARRDRDASRFDVSVARANRLPSVNATLGGSYSSFLGSIPSVAGGFNIPNSARAADAGIGVTLPIFQGGRPAAQVRQAQARESQAIENVTATERNVVAQARSAFAVYQGSLQVIESAEVAVAANRLALEGVRAENSVGTRTVLDILDAEQELLNSQVTLVTARRDAYVAGFSLLAATGNAEARDLGLGGGQLYDPEVNYRRVRARFIDFDSDPRPMPVATSTANTPSQRADVTRPLDPLLNSAVDRSTRLTTGEDAPDRQ